MRLTIDGREIEVAGGTTVAAAVALASAIPGPSAPTSATPGPSVIPGPSASAGARPGPSVRAAAPASAAPVFRYSARGNEPRAAICGMGICHECRVSIDGQAQLRSCLTPCRSGMEVVTGAGDPPVGRSGARAGGDEFPARDSVAPEIPGFADVLVIGAGPAGLAAAARAGRSGREVVLVDENPGAGGQIWRGEGNERSKPRHALHLPGTAVVDYRVGSDGDRHLVLLRGSRLHEVRFRDLVLATGARELFLPFPGWTLPNVFGAGGLQALVKSGWPIEGRRVVVAGSGPLLLAVASLLRGRGAEVVTVAEQASLGSVLSFGKALLGRPAKWAQAAELRTQLAGVPYRLGHWVVEAKGRGRLERVVLTDGRTRWSERCDALAVAYGLVPASELAGLLGCETDSSGAVRVESDQSTSLPRVFAAGELTGIGGLDLSLAQGEIVGSVLAGDAEDGEERRRLLAERERARRFAKSMETAFSLRPEVLELARSDTIVCRCEDVSWGELREHQAWRDAKLVTRCGMGPCQGRVCGAALRQLCGWQPGVPRPPLSPVPVDAWIR